jgi:putative oxidoreductase
MQILRQALGLFFVIFGITKIIPVLGFGYGFAGTVGFVASLGYPVAALLVAAAIATEIGLGLLLLLPKLDEAGNSHKYAAFGLAAFTILATLMFHVPFVGGEVLTVELTNTLKNVIIIVALFVVGKEIKQIA